MIKRRQFIAGLGSAAAWPLPVGAQQRERMRRIGVLMAGSGGEHHRVLKHFESEEGSR